MALKSSRSATDTMTRLEQVVTQRGLRVFARIDHAAGAASIGRSLRPTVLLIFGHPKGGTPLMECAQTTGIDLPLKALVWEDGAGQVWLGYSDPALIAARHGAAECAAAGKLRQTLSEIVEAVIAPQVP